MATNSDYENIGVPWLAAFCYKLEDKEILLNIDLEELFTEKRIRELVVDRMRTASRDMTTLERFNGEEYKIIHVIQKKIVAQTGYLAELRGILQEAEAIRGKQPTPSQPTPTADEQEFQRLENAAHTVCRDMEKDLIDSVSLNIGLKEHPNIRIIRQVSEGALAILVEGPLTNGKPAVFVPLVGRNITKESISGYYEGFSRGMIKHVDVRKFARTRYDANSDDFKIVEKGLIRKGAEITGGAVKVLSIADEKEYQRLEKLGRDMYEAINSGADIKTFQNLGKWINKKGGILNRRNLSFISYRNDICPVIGFMEHKGKPGKLHHGQRVVILPQIGIPMDFYSFEGNFISDYFEGYARGMVLDSSDVVKFARAIYNEPAQKFDIIEQGIIRKGSSPPEDIKGWMQVYIIKPVSHNVSATSDHPIIPNLALGRKITELEAWIVAEVNSTRDEIEKEQSYTFEWYMQQRLKGKALIHTGRMTKNPDMSVPYNFRSGKEAKLIVEVKRNSDSKIIATDKITVRLVKPEELDSDKKLDLIADVDIIYPEKRNIPIKGRSGILPGLQYYRYLPPILHIGEGIRLEAKARVKSISEDMAEVADSIDAEKGYKFEWYLEQVQRRGIKKVLRKVLMHRGSRTGTPFDILAGSQNPIPQDVFKKGPAKLLVEVVRLSDSVTIGFAHMDVILERGPKEIVNEEIAILNNVPRYRFNRLTKEDEKKLGRVSRGAAVALSVRNVPERVGRAVFGIADYIMRRGKDKKTREEGKQLRELEIERREATGAPLPGEEPRKPAPRDLDMERSEEADRAKSELSDELDKLLGEE